MIKIVLCLSKVPKGDVEAGNGGLKSKFAAATSFFKRKKNKGEQQTNTKETKGWVQPEDKNTKSVNTDTIGLVTVLTNQNR